MSGNGQSQNGASNGSIMHWKERVLSADDVRRRLNGELEIVLDPKTIVTPLADEQLRIKGIRLTRQTSESNNGSPKPALSWGFAQERPNAMVHSAVENVRREGIALWELKAASQDTPCRWAQAVSECVAKGECRGGVVFCQDPGLVCCVANKLSGLRAVSVTNIAQAARATLSLGANLLAVEMPGRTYFEVRQVLRLLCAGSTCPDSVACTLRELENHAHR